MALGGVDTGSADPKLAPNVTPNIGGTGSIPALVHRLYTTGNKAEAVAVLLVNSLNRIAATTAMPVNIPGSCVPRRSNAALPTASARPVRNISPPSARAAPNL